MGTIVPTRFSDITPAEFRKLEDLRFKTTMDVAAFLGTTDHTVRDWRTGKKNIPKSVAMLLGLMQHYELSPSDVYEITREGSRS
jgi:DNA-binding transcriptional regulator YiaG